MPSTSICAMQYVTENSLNETDKTINIIIE